MAMAEWMRTCPRCGATLRKTDPALPWRCVCGWPSGGGRRPASVEGTEFSVERREGLVEGERKSSWMALFVGGAFGVELQDDFGVATLVNEIRQTDAQNSQCSMRRGDPPPRLFSAFAGCPVVHVGTTEPCVQPVQNGTGGIRDLDLWRELPEGRAVSQPHTAFSVKNTGQIPQFKLRQRGQTYGAPYRMNLWRGAARFLGSTHTVCAGPIVASASPAQMIESIGPRHVAIECHARLDHMASETTFLSDITKCHGACASRIAPRLPIRHEAPTAPRRSTRAIRAGWKFRHRFYFVAPRASFHRVSSLFLNASQHN